MTFVNAVGNNQSFPFNRAAAVTVYAGAFFYGNITVFDEFAVFVVSDDGSVRILNELAVFVTAGDFGSRGFNEIAFFVKISDDGTGGIFDKATVFDTSADKAAVSVDAHMFKDALIA